MSELRVALIAEGPTDAIVIEAGLRAVIDKPFVLQTLQPEATRPNMGTGWCGVFKWCRDFAARGYSGLENDPTLPGFDLFILHVDADLAERSYAEGGTAVERAAHNLLPLPCSRPCPPPAAAADEVRRRLAEWLGFKQVGPRTVACVPSKAIEAWLAAGVLRGDHVLLNGLECNLGLDRQLASLPRNQRIGKTQLEYLQHRETVTRRWDDIRRMCTQAERFHLEAGAALAVLANEIVRDLS